MHFSGSIAGRFLEASWRSCHSSSGFSLSQFVLFLHVIPDRLDDDDDDDFLFYFFGKEIIESITFI